MRQAFSEIITQTAEKYPNLAFITGDLGFQVFDDFKNKYGARYINAGVAEAQMICAAAGMASEGFRPVAYSIASFASARPYEQIRFTVSYPNLPVVLVGAGRGYTYSTAGVSHHASDDLGLMAMLPGMTVVAPGDPTEVTQLFPQLFELNGPSYFTVGRFGEPRYEAEEDAVLGKARLLRNGKKAAIISAGEMANEVLKAADILDTEHINPAVYQIHTIKPLDTETLNNLSDKMDYIIITEEHVPNGGLWPAVCAWHAESGSNVKLIRMGPPDAYALGNLKLDELRKRWGYDADAIAAKVRANW